jgi:hypothetical protein
MEGSMKIPTVCGALVLAGLVSMIAPTTVSLAQLNDKDAPTSKKTSTSAPDSSARNTNTNPTKHRHWRHRGGAHPHYGSRRIRT